MQKNPHKWESNGTEIPTLTIWNHICTSGLMERSRASYKLKGLLWFLSAPQNRLPGKEGGDADSKSHKTRDHLAASNHKTGHPHI